MASHDFDNHDALVAGRGRVQSIERVHHHRDRGIETEGHGGGFQIVVDRFGNADAIDPRFLQLQRRRHRAITADDDQRFNSKFIEHFASFGDHVRRNDRPIAAANLGDEMSAIGRADDSAAKRHDTIGPFAIENDVIARRKQAFKAIAKTDDFPAKFFRGEHNAAQHRV